MTRAQKVLFQLAAVALVAVAATACASGGAGGMSEELDPDAPSFTLQIDNDNFYDARVQIFWNGQGQMLGRVRGSTTEVYELPYNGNRIRLRIEFVGGGRRYDSEHITVNPDQIVRYRIDP